MGPFCHVPSRQSGIILHRSLLPCKYGMANLILSNKKHYHIRQVVDDSGLILIPIYRSIVFTYAKWRGIYKECHLLVLRPNAEKLRFTKSPYLAFALDFALAFALPASPEVSSSFRGKRYFINTE